jgi:ABC-type cobalamin/Fe3+-siderophores transport system ATPase subunit
MKGRCDVGWSLDFEVSNYRCFPDDSPARFTIRDGFTAFVGPNNAGKSAVLRMLFDLRPVFSTLLDDRQRPELLQSGSAAIPFPGRSKYARTSPLEDILSRRNDRPMRLTIGIQPPAELTAPGDERLFEGINIYVAHDGTATAEPSPPLDDTKTIHSNRPGGESFRLGNGGTYDSAGIVWAAHLLQNAMYVGPFRNAVNVGGQEGYYDLSIGERFITNWDQAKRGEDRKTHEAIARLEHELARIFGFDSLDIDMSQEVSSLHVLVDGTSYDMNDHGAGLAQFIIVLGSVLFRQPKLLLIDEPELNLHPSLQVDFLTALGSTSEAVVFATHSLGLARAAADRLYSARRIEQGKSTVADFEGTRNLTELVGELSYSGYRDLGYDRVLLVEGPSDVRTMQQFLRWWRVEHKTVIVPLGGASLINGARTEDLRELARLAPNVFAVIDSEKSAETEPLAPDRAGFATACEEVEINCHILKRRATENYLADDAVKNTFGDKYRALEPFERTQDVEPFWGKSQNWLIARAMRPEDLQDTDLGVFLARVAAIGD